MKVELRCPKCASNEVERGKNQEIHCKQCGETFYFVTPQCSSKTNLERYEL